MARGSAYALPTPLPMSRGFVYLVVVLDWYSRRVLSWRVSMTMAVDFCLEALEEAGRKHGRPESPSGKFISDCIAFVA